MLSSIDNFSTLANLSRTDFSNSYSRRKTTSYTLILSDRTEYFRDTKTISLSIHHQLEHKHGTPVNKCF